MQTALIVSASSRDSKVKLLRRVPVIDDWRHIVGATVTLQDGIGSLAMTFQFIFDSCH